MGGRWLEPEPALPPSAPGGDVLTAEQVRKFRDAGFLVVDGLWPAALVEAAAADSAEIYGTPDSHAAAVALAQQQQRLRDSPSGAGTSFPFAQRSFNSLTLHSRTLRAVAQLLGQSEQQLRLTQAGAGAKYGAMGQGGPADMAGSDQQMHRGEPS